MNWLSKVQSRLNKPTYEDQLFYKDIIRLNKGTELFLWYGGNRSHLIVKLIKLCRMKLAGKLRWQLKVKKLDTGTVFIISLAEMGCIPCGDKHWNKRNFIKLNQRGQLC